MVWAKHLCDACCQTNGEKKITQFRRYFVFSQFEFLSRGRNRVDHHVYGFRMDAHRWSVYASVACRTWRMDNSILLLTINQADDYTNAFKLAIKSDFDLSRITYRRDYEWSKDFFIFFWLRQTTSECLLLLIWNVFLAIVQIDYRICFYCFGKMSMLNGHWLMNREMDGHKTEFELLMGKRIDAWVCLRSCVLRMTFA